MREVNKELRHSGAPHNGEPGVHGAARASGVDSGFFASRTPGMTAMAALFALTACSAPEAPRIYDRDPSLPENLPFSSAVVVGDTIYLSGEIGRTPGTVTLVEGGVGPQTEAIFENYKLTLARVGASLDDIVKCTVFLDEMSKFSEMNAAYVKFFPDEKPARSTFGVDGLAFGAALEIECLAVKS
jgi:2-iminobutanoate/2-iminopropanoate deaminase